MPFAFVLAVVWCAATAFSNESGSVPVLYLIAETTVVRSAPDPKAPAIAKLKAFDIVSGTETARGWLRIDGATSDAASSGWVPFNRDNVVHGPVDALRGRAFRLHRTRWPQSVKLDILKGRVRPGFTGDQVKLALGDPLQKNLRQLGADVVEEWIYAERRIVFSHSGVRVVETLVTAK
jgi:hypothetical protein